MLPSPAVMPVRACFEIYNFLLTMSPALQPTRLPRALLLLRVVVACLKVCKQLIALATHCAPSTAAPHVSQADESIWLHLLAYLLPCTWHRKQICTSACCETIVTVHILSC